MTSSGVEFEQEKSKLLQNYLANRNEFWNLRVEELQRRWGTERGDFGLIQSVLEQFHPESILEVGCGYGRYLPLYAGIRHVVGLDLSSAMLARAAEVAPWATLRCQAIKDIDDLADSFDLVVACRVLAHVPPVLISKAVENIARVCRKACVVLERTGPFEQSPYEFSHNYLGLFGGAGLVLAQDIEQKELAHFYVFLKPTTV